MTIIKADVTFFIVYIKKKTNIIPAVTFQFKNGVLVISLN